MKYIFVDFEMHPIARKYKEERKVCSSEIIEFGAVMLDEDFSEISSFKKYVKPSYVNSIYAKISDLTGITYSMLVGAESFNNVLAEFVEWCYSFGEDIIVYAWSDSDLLQLNREMKLKDTIIDEKCKSILNNWVDFQKEYCEIIEEKNPISLEKALSSIGEYFIGKVHDALYDARNTATLFGATRDREEFLKQIKPIEDMVNQTTSERVTFSLGDLFNFDMSQFVVA